MERWTKEQENLLIEKYMNTDYKTLSGILNKTEGAIRAKCFELNGGTSYEKITCSVYVVYFNGFCCWMW